MGRGQEAEVSNACGSCFAYVVLCVSMIISKRFTAVPISRNRPADLESANLARGSENTHEVVACELLLPATPRQA
jgi:hypothetical protein